MNRRIYYAVRDGHSPIAEVVLVPEADGSVVLYCPPGVAGGPWVERFPTLEQGRDLASNLAREIGQTKVNMTSTLVDWEQSGLRLIGDADERDRERDQR